MKATAALWLAGLATLGVTACGSPDASDSWLGALTMANDPAGLGSRYPHLAGGDGHVVMSWLQALPQGGFALQHARWKEGAWGLAATVASGGDWFVNWADFPSVVPLDATTWAARLAATEARQRLFPRCAHRREPRRRRELVGADVAARRRHPVCASPWR